MKIVYLHQYFNTPSMVGGTRSYELARRLVAKGHQVEMVTSWREPGARRGWFTSVEEGINVHWLPVPYGNHMSYRQRIVAFLRFAVAAARKAASFDADVVYATSTPLTIALPAVYAARRMRCPMVFEVRDLWPEMPIAIGALKNPVARRAARWLERYAYRNSTRIVALSPGMAAGVAATGYPTERISVIPNSADLELFATDADAAMGFRAAHPELGDAPIVLYAGTFGIVNGVGWLVELAAEAERAGLPCKVVLVGSGYETDKIVRKARDAGVLGVNCFIYDPMTKAGVVAAFQAASVICSVFVPLKEMEANSANKFFDGLAAGKPMAINYGGWQAELLMQNGAGLVMPREPSAAVRILGEWLHDPVRLAQAGVNARALAEREFGRDLLADRLESVLLEAVK